MDSKTVLLTGNTSTMYAVGFLDLLKDGPTVIDLPPGMLGILDDMAFQYMVDLGVAGPDKGKGGKYLVLPPGYKGTFPKATLSFLPKPVVSGSSCAAISTRACRSQKPFQPLRRISATP